MILWNTEKLAEALKANQLTEREKFHYVLFYSVVMAMIYPLQKLSGGPRIGHYLDHVFNFLAAFLTIGGCVFSYQTNAKGDGLRFLERYICLAVPIGIKAYIICFFASVAFGFVVEGALPGPEYAFIRSILFGCLVLAYEVVFYQRLAVWLRRVSGG